MSLQLEIHDRDSSRNDRQTGTVSMAPCRITGTMPDGTPIGPFDLADGESLTLVVDELGGGRAAADAAAAEAAAVAAGKQGAVLDAFRRANRLAAHLEGPTHGLRPEEVPQDAERLHMVLHPDGMAGHEAI